MTLSRRLRAAVLTAALFAPATAAAQTVPCPPVPCPPIPLMPIPGLPGVPGTAPTPGTPTPAPGAPTPPSTPDTPPAAPSAPPAPSSDLSASATAGQGGGGSGGSSLPGIFGDFPGGGGVAAPFLAQFDAIGRPIGATGLLIVNGRPLAGPNRPADELLLRQAGGGIAPPGTPVARTEVIRSGIARENLPLVPRIPQYNRGTFKITENETPRPTTRAYLTYNYFDNVFGSTGVNAPRVQLHQQNFGYEHAFADQRYSVGLRLPYNQVVSPGYINETSLGDLTIVTKAVISENRCTGDLLSGGLSITVPTGNGPVSSVNGAPTPTGVLLQPYLGYVLVNGDVFLQGFSSVVVPTDRSDVVLFTQSLAVGYALLKRPGCRLSGIYPVIEAHLNTPLNHRDSRNETVYFPDSLTLLGGTFFEFYSRSTLGFAVGAPVTGPRPFSLQATCQLSIRF